MVKYSAKLDATFAALSDPTRRAILSRLARGDTSVGELARPFNVSLPAVSKHLRVLQRAGLLTQDRRESQGRLGVEPKKIALRHVETSYISRRRFNIYHALSQPRNGTELGH